MNEKQTQIVKDLTENFTIVELMILMAVINTAIAEHRSSHKIKEEKLIV